jgi:hypothetical protein
MALTRQLPSPISNLEPADHHIDKNHIKDVNLSGSQDMTVETNSDCTFSSCSSSKKRKEFEQDKDDDDDDHHHHSYKKQVISCITDPVLDEAADEVAEESEWWDLILQQWNADRENMSFLITA